MYAGSGGYPANSTARALKDKKVDVSSQKSFVILPNINDLYPKIDAVVHSNNYIYFFGCLCCNYFLWQNIFWHWWAPFVISTIKDVFTNQPHCWTHLALNLCSVLFLSECLMFLGMAILKRAAWKLLQHQQDGKAMLCLSVKVSGGLSVTQRVLSSTVNSAFCMLQSTPSWFFPLLLCCLVAFKHTVISSVNVVL